MPDCINPTNTDNIQAEQPHSPLYEQAMAETERAEFEAETRERAELGNVLDPFEEEQSAVAPSGVVSVEAKRAAHAIFSLDTVKDAFSNARASYENILDRMHGVRSIGQTSKMLELATQVSSLFKDTRAPIRKAIMLYFPQEGKNSGANDMIAAFDGIDNRAVGEMATFNNNLFVPLRNDVKELASANGFASADDFLHNAVGNYALMLHMPEANAHLLERWRNQLDDIDSPEPPEFVREKIDRLERYLDWEGRNDENDRGIVCAGRTNGYARAWIRRFHDEHPNLTPELMQQLSARLTHAAEQINVRRDQSGINDVTMFEDRQNNFEHYVPIKTVSNISQGLPTDASIYNPGKLRAREGISTKTELSDAYASVYRFAQAASMEIGAAPFGQYAVAMAKTKGRSQPFRAERYNEAILKSLQNNQYGRQYRGILEGERGFAMVTSIPDANGTMTRYLVHIDPSFTDAARNVSGYELNEAMRSVQTGTVARVASNVTGFLAGLNTHYNVFFPMVNAVKDAGERLNNLFGQSYKLTDGTLVDGDKFARRYIANIPKAASFIANYMLGRVTDLNSSPLGVHWQEYIQQGVKQEFDPLWSKENSVQHILNDTAQTGKGVPTGMLAFLKKVDDASRVKILNAVHKWNDYWNNISAFAQFHTLREAGVSLESARQGTHEVINLRESGSLTPTLRALYAFAKPTAQGAASLARSLGLAPNASGQFKPNMKGIAFFLSGLAGLAIMQNMASSAMGEDVYDQLSVDELSRSVYLPLDADGNVFKIPIPFGHQTIAATLATVADRVMRGKLDPIDGTGHILRSILKATTPAEYPNFSMKTDPLKWLSTMFVPSAAMPLWQVATNTNHFGTPITQANRNGTLPMHMQGAVTTPSGWHTLAHLLSGMGFDYAPEQLRTLVDGYMGGALRFIPQVISSESQVQLGFDKTTQGILGPWLSALGTTMLYRKIPETHQNIFYEEYEDLKAEIRDLNVRLAEKGAYSDTSSRERIWRNKLEDAGLESDKIDRYLNMYNIEQDKKKLTRELKERVQSEDFPDLSYNEQQSIYQDYLDNCEILYRRALGI